MSSKELLNAVWHYPQYMIPGILFFVAGVGIAGGVDAILSEQFRWYEEKVEAWYRVGGRVFENLSFEDQTNIETQYPGGEFELHMRKEPMQLPEYIKPFVYLVLGAYGINLMKRGFNMERARAAQ